MKFEKNLVKNFREYEYKVYRKKLLLVLLCDFVFRT